MALPLNELDGMLLDRPHLDAYAEALRRTVTPASVVYDLKAGTGLLSLIACRLGARRVFAVERTAAAEIVIEAAKDNGYAGRIVVLHAPPTQTTSHEHVDVVVSPVHKMPLSYPTDIVDLAAAWHRVASPDTHLLPEACTLWFAVVSAPEAFARTQAARNGPPYGLDLRSTSRYMENSPQPIRSGSECLLGEPVQWSRLEFRSMSAFRPRGGGTFTVVAGGTAHGLLAWLDTEITDEIGVSNSPGSGGAAASQVFFPWPESVALEPGDQVEVGLRGDLVAGQMVWTWTTEIRAQRGDTSGFRHARQSSFLSAPVSRETLRKRSVTFVPNLSTSGQLVLEVLGKVRPGATVGDLAGELQAAHPAVFNSRDEAHGFVAAVCERYASPNGRGDS